MDHWQITYVQPTRLGQRNRLYLLVGQLLGNVSVDISGSAETDMRNKQ